MNKKKEKWLIYNTCLVNINCNIEDCSLEIPIFEHLTGKRINWDIRNSKTIISVREKGHIRLYDSIFIEGQYYKNKTGTYLCTKVDKKGIALLNKQGNNMIIKSAKDPEKENWEIV